MRDAQLVNSLSELPVSQLIGIQHEYGRLNLPAAFREFWTKQHQHACEILEDESRGLNARRLARLLKDITHSLATVEVTAQPTYYQYTDAHLLDWFLDPGLATLSSLRSRIILGLHYVLKDLLEFEMYTLGGVEEKNHAKQAVPQKLHERTDEIKNVFPAIRELAVQSGADCRWDYDLQRYPSLAGYVNEPTGLSALVHFSCFPLTQFHDEVVFIRVLHGSELCFFGIRLCLIAAIEAIKSEKPAVAERELERGDGFARILHLFLKVLRTMPKEHFADFRDFTGKASALQSKAYHELDIYMRGVNIEKRHHFERGYLKPLLRYADKRFISLKDSLRRVMDLPEWQGVVDMARSLDKNMLSWRGLHVGFAKGYIPKGGHGTGGTAGAAYLEQYLNDGIFKGTEMDWALVERIFASDPDVIDELHRINTRATISSGDRL